MDKQPKVSVCIPAYNRQDFISETIESVLNQTFSDWELIITDNCSTDNTLNIIKEYASKDKRIVFRRNSENLGACSNGNMGYLLARGEYVKCLCSDDKMDPRQLEVFVDVLDKHPDVSIVTSFTKDFGETQHFRGENYFPATGLIDGKTSQKDLLFNGNWIGSPSSTLFRHKDMHVGMNNKMWQFWVTDLELWMRLLGVGNAYVVPEVLSYLRIHSGQESTVHAQDFRLIRERIMLANIAFWFPHLYGHYSSKEQIQIHRHLLKRLTREGLGTRGLKPKIDMFKLGMSRLSYSRTYFLLTVLKNIGRLFRKSRWSGENKTQ